jgi:transformation/transcription domain-associated protein
MRLANALLERAPDARKRGLGWHTPAIVPVWPQLRLLEEEPSYASYYEAYEGWGGDGVGWGGVGGVLGG